MIRVSLESASTEALITELRRAALAHQRTTRLGAAYDAIGDYLEGAWRRASEVSQVATQAALDAAGTPFAWAYRKLKEGALDLSDTAAELARRGMAAQSAVADEVGRRAWMFAEGLAAGGRNALSQAGAGLGDLARNFWGLPTWGLLLAGLVVLAGGGVLILSPGGQALLTGGARAIAAGGGDLLAGGGRALTSAALRV